MKVLAISVAALLCVAGVHQLRASDYQITRIKPIFSKATPLHGDFQIHVGIKNHTASKKKVAVVCLYSGLTWPGVYYKNQPELTRQYKLVELGPSEEKEVVFDKGFSGYHPEVLGEIIVSIAGTGVVRSIPLKTAFFPPGQD
jgi:hypothetical protein